VGLCSVVLRSEQSLVAAKWDRQTFTDLPPNISNMDLELDSFHHMVECSTT
jgi:hypothetical protein